MLVGPWVQELGAIWFEMTLNYGMMVERYSNLKEEVGGLIPGCEISSLLDRKLARWSTASCALVLACRPSVSKMKIRSEHELIECSHWNQSKLSRKISTSIWYITTTFNTYKEFYRPKNMQGFVRRLFHKHEFMWRPPNSTFNMVTLTWREHTSKRWKGGTCDQGS